MLKVEKNIGILNALIRITIGFALLSWSTAKLAKRPSCNSYLLLSICAAMKVSEGIVQYCPVTALYHKYRDSSSNQNKPALLPPSFEETVPE